MATIRRFEDLEIWQIARKLSKEVYQATCLGAFSKDFGLRNQLNDSAGSIMDNISEGFERGGKLEFVNFLSYSKGSSGETRSQLYRAFDRHYISQEELEYLQKQYFELGNRIGKLIIYLNQSEFKGTKFKDRVSNPKDSLKHEATPNSKLQTPNFKL